MNVYNIIIMDELITIIEQRKVSIAIIKANQERRHKSLLVEQERKRNQRQNWILRVLKTLKFLTPEQKKIIFETSVKIMNYYQPMEARTFNFQTVNYIETFINLFVEFYNKFTHLDLTHIKTIIRPNNGYIIVDLIKTLVDLGRKTFKNAVQELYKEITPVRPDRRERSMGKGETISVQIESREDEESLNITRQKQNQADINVKISQVLFEKYNRMIDQYNPELCHQRFNQIYFDLIYANSKNSRLIQKYLDSCFGNKRHIGYDASGLYTQEEMKKMQNQQQQKANYRKSELKQLKGKCSPEHLRQYFKIKVQMHETLSSLPSFVKNPSIRTWFPITILKNGDKVHPYNQVIQMNGVYYDPFQFEEKTNKKLKTYMKELLKQEFKQTLVNKTEDQQLSTFNRRDYLDFNNSKILELLVKEVPPTYKKDKCRQTIFPPLNMLSIQMQGKSMSKVKSEGKLSKPNHIVNFPKGDNLGQMLEKRMNHSSNLNEGNNSKRKMDRLIDTLIRGREYTIN